MTHQPLQRAHVHARAQTEKREYSAEGMQRWNRDPCRPRSPAHDGAEPAVGQPLVSGGDPQGIEVGCLGSVSEVAEHLSPGRSSQVRGMAPPALGVPNNHPPAARPTSFVSRLRNSEALHPVSSRANRMARCRSPEQLRRRQVLRIRCRLARGIGSRGRQDSLGGDSLRKGEVQPGGSYSFSYQLRKARMLR